MKAVNRVVAAFVLLSSAAGQAGACSVPVFRWALERWEADNYRLTVRRPWPELETLRQKAGEAHANLHVEAVENELGPEFTLLYPPASHHQNEAMKGELAAIAPETLLDSPVRRELARRILDGHSGVWLLLESGDAAKDAACEVLLNEAIGHANGTLKLPDMADDPVLQGPDAPDISNLRVEFSVIKVARDDPAERALVEMLLGIEPDLRDYADPLAFPVYGRGRVLYGLVGAGINAATVGKACAFLVGRCACEIKAENPGTDLLMSVDWDNGMKGERVIGNVAPPPLAGAALAPGDVAAAHEAPAQAPRSRTAFYAGGAAGVVIAVVIGVSLILLRRGRSA